MSDPFLAEIRIFATDWAPQGWAQCNGQLMPVVQNTALFSLLGTMYGGDGKTNFALPNLQRRVPLQSGLGPGLSSHVVGEMGGSATVTLLQNQMPMHTHQLMHSGGTASAATPDPSLALARTASAQLYTTTGTATPATPQALGPAGASTPHNNMQPYLALNFCIALQGIFPPRS
ncbi:MAG TPA: phage tail protein [Massilia sp.]|nr:phage tail protein [Massilia sp.]